MLSKATLVTYFVITVFTFEPLSINVFAYVYSFHPCEKIEMYIGHTWVWVLHHVWHVCAQAQLLFVQLDNSLITTIFDTIMCWEFMYSYLSFTSSLKVTFITIVLNSFISLSFVLLQPHVRFAMLITNVIKLCLDLDLYLHFFLQL